MTTNKKLFCSKPFTWFEVSQGTEVDHKGDVYMCCPAWLDTSIGNLKNQSVDEIWNGKKAQNIRRSILDGSFEYCSASKCPFLQTVSGPVQLVEDVEDQDLQKVIEDKLVVLPKGPKEINCSYDRSCNLSCPTCREEVIVERENEEQILAIQQKIRSEALPDARFLYITGSGDPFGSPFFKKWLQTMEKAEMPNLDEIRLHSNAQLWTPAIWETIPDEVRPLIKSAEISIDAATSETYAINRRGGDFIKLLRNLEFISSLRQHGPLQSVTISMVVQENNFKEMPDFVRLGQRFGFDVVYFSQLVNWGTFSDAEFTSRAVHLPSHPKYSELVALLGDEIFNSPVANLGNLTEVRKRSTAYEKPTIFKKAQKLIARIASR